MRRKTPLVLRIAPLGAEGERLRRRLEFLRRVDDIRLSTRRQADAHGEVPLAGVAAVDAPLADHRWAARHFPGGVGRTILGRHLPARQLEDLGELVEICVFEIEERKFVGGLGNGRTRPSR